MIRKLKWKFVLINMTLVTLVLAALFSVIIATTQTSLVQDSMDALDQAINLSASRGPGFSDHLMPENEEEGLIFFGTQRVQLPYLTVELTYTSQVYVLANQFFDTSDESALLAVIQTATDSPDSSGVIHDQGYHLRFLRTTGLMGQRIAFVDLTQERSTLAALGRNLTFICLGTLALFFVISLLLSRWAVRPVEKSWKQQRQFVADASHELKTPLTVLLSSLDMLETYGGEDPEKEQRWLDNMHACSRQMKTLVEEMLVLARSDNATQQVVFTQCDLRELVEDELLLFEAPAFEQGKTLEETLAEGIFVTGDAVLLRRIIDIYLDNACKYGAQGSVIRVELKSEGKRALLSVRSEGTPIPKEDLARIFERFYRSDPSRTEEGYGLGLAIATELAKLHHGKVWAQSDETGNTFYFSLPRSKE